MNKAFLLVLLLLVGCGPKTFNYGALPTALPQLVVQAEGSVKATPDLLQMRLGVVTEGAQAGTAVDNNNQRMAAVMAMLREIGIGDADMATGQFQIRPEWSRPPRPTPADWQRQIVGYQVSNELLISTTQVALAGQLLGLAQRAGANQIGGLQFSLADPSEHRQRAIEKAIERAMRKAETMALAAGVKLGAVQSLSLGSTGGAPQPRLMMAEARMAGAEPVPVAAGQVEVAAAVTIVYRLEEGAKE